MLLRSAPIRTLSLASSKSYMSTALRLLRAAFKAASLTMLESSAPENPGVPRATVAANCVNLVNEDNARRVLLALLKQVANAAGAHADKHFHEIRSGDAEEGHIGFAGYGPGQQGLTCSRMSHQQNALGDAPTQF